MGIKKTTAGMWVADEQPGGRAGKRYQKTFPTKAEALSWVAWLKTNKTQAPEWSPRKDKRRLSALIENWWQEHGQHLKAGKDTHSRLLALDSALRSPLAHQVSQSMLAQYRARKLEEGNSPATMNRTMAYLRAMFQHHIKTKAWRAENPVTNFSRLKEEERELSWLTLDQVKHLLADLRECRNQHVCLIAKVSLATGGRWGEVESMAISQVGAGRMTFSRTKSSKTRTIPISRELETELRAHREAHQLPEGRLFTDGNRSTFTSVLNRSGIELPKGQAAHVLRHSFASHFIQRTGDILCLQKLLGHSDLKVTMRYAHLAPEHLQKALTHNPLALLENANVASIHETSMGQLKDMSEKGFAAEIAESALRLG